MIDKTEAQPEALRLADRLIGNAEIDECEGCNPVVVALERSAAAELRRQHAEIQQLKAQQNELREEQRLCMLEASGLANSMFKKHFSHERHYASGEVVWGLCDSVRGVISQIDNMASGLVRSESQLSARQAAPDGQWKCGDEYLLYHPDASHVDPAYRDGWNDCYRASPPPPKREPLTDDQIARAAVNAGVKPIYDKPKKPMVNALGSSVPYTWLKAFAHGIGATNG